VFNDTDNTYNDHEPFYDDLKLSGNGISDDDFYVFMSTKMQLKVFHEFILRAIQHEDPRPPILSIDGTDNCTDQKNVKAIFIVIQNHNKSYKICSISICHNESAETVFQCLSYLWIKSQEL